VFFFCCSVILKSEVINEFNFSLLQLKLNSIAH